MSNLSELLPAGGGGKNVSFVASGTLPNGKTVILNSDGTATVVGSTGSGESIPAGSEYIFNLGSQDEISISFDPNTTGKFVVAFRDGSNSGYGTAVVGTISGTSITFGSKYVFNTASTVQLQVNFNPNTAGNLVITYEHGVSPYYGTSVVGTVSGTSISFGSKVVFNSKETVYIRSSFDPNTAGKFVVAYRDVGNSNYGTAIIGTVSGTSITYGSGYIFNSAVTIDPVVSFDPSTAGKFVVAYGDNGNSNYGTAIAGVVSGTSISYGSEYVFINGLPSFTSMAFDPNTAGKFIVSFMDSSNSNYGTAIAGVVSGTSISFGSKYVFNNGYTPSTSVAFDPNTANKFVVAYQNAANSYYGTAIVGDVSGTSLSFGVGNVLNSAQSNLNKVAFDPNTAGKFVVAYQDQANSQYGTAIIGEINTLSTNLTATNFLGITDAAITSGASGSVTIKGGLKTGLAGGTFAVTVANPGAGNRYYINGVLQQTLNLREGFTYKFDQSASSNSGHPFRFSTTSNGTHAGGSEYTTGVTTSGTPGNAGAYTQIVVAASAPTLYYYCTNHSGMGGTANTLAAFVPNSIYYVQADGSVSTVTTSPAVRIGKALSSTTLNLEFSS